MSARLRILVTIALASASIVAIVVIGLRRSNDGSTEIPTALRNADRFFEARVSVADVHHAYRAARFVPPPELPVREAVERADRSEASSSEVSIGSIIEAALGNPASASARLGGAARRDPRSYEVWLDLSAVLFAQAGDEPDAAGQLLTAALDAALHATQLNPGDPRGWFNAALALERFGITSAAADAFRTAAARETDPAWKIEIEQRIEQLRGRDYRAQWQAAADALADASSAVDRSQLARVVPNYHQPVRELIEDRLFPAWADRVLGDDAAGAARLLERAALLSEMLRDGGGDPLCAAVVTEIRAAHDHRLYANAFQQFSAAQRFYEASDRESALQAILRSITFFRRAGSQFADRARNTLASTLYQLGRSAEAEQLALQIERDSAAGGRPSLEAAGAWLAGIVQTQRGAADDALQSYQRAATVFERLGERQDLAAVHTSAANLLRITGDLSAGWQHVTAATRLLDHVHTARRLNTMLLNASLFAGDQDKLAAALAFEEWSLRAAEERGVANTIVEGFLRRGRLRLRLGDTSGAASDLQQAIDRAPAIGSQSAKSYMDSWLALVKGESVLRSAPSEAIAQLQRAKDLFTAVEPAELPNVHLVAARARLAMRDTAGAERELRQGIDVVIARRDQIHTATLQTAYQDATWELFDRLISLTIDRGDHGEAFRLAEAARELLFGRDARRADVSPEQVGAALGESTCVIYYVSTRDRLLVWTISRRGVRFASKPIGRDDIEAMVNRYRAALVSNLPGVDALAAALHAQLLREPLSDVPRDSLVIVVPDAALHRLPFASLRDAAGRYAIETYRIAAMPSAAAVLRSNRAAAVRADDAPIVVVGSSRTPGLPALPEVTDEVREISALYTNARPLIGDAATYHQTLRALSGAAALHFAGHAKANIAVPWQSRLFFVPDAALPSGVVTAEMLLKEKLDSLQLVVFSACETGDGPILRGTGVSSLASTMVSLGVPSVVASLWAIEDRPMKRLLTAFHGAYARGAPATEALRTAQLSMLHSNDPAFAPPQFWSGVTIASAR